MVRTVLRNATLVDLVGPTVGTGHVVVEDRYLHAVGLGPAPEYEGARYEDLHGALLLPGNICGHTHVYSALARGMPAPPATPRSFVEILQQVWWRLDRALDEASIRSSAVVAALDAVSSGTTTLVDHHASPNFIDGSLDLLADGLAQVGVRGVLCYEVTDRGGVERRDAGIAENVRFLQSNERATMTGMIGGHASFTLGDDSLRLLAEVAQEGGVPVHIHVAEDAFDEEDALRRSGTRAAIRLKEAGVLPKGSIAAHGVYLNGAEIAALERDRVWIAHNCRSNMNNSVGRAPVLAFGDRCSLGTDGIDHDMFAEVRSAFFRLREDGLESGAETAGAMLARNGMIATERFGVPLGRLTAGAAADLVVLEYDAPTPLTGENLWWHWMFAFTPRMVRDVMIDGSWVMRDRVFPRVDEEKARAEARAEAKRLWLRMDDLPA